MGIEYIGGSILDAETASPVLAEDETQDILQIIQNSCMRCDRKIGKSEVRVVPPQIVQEQDSYVAAGKISKRVMCVPCYNELKTPSRVRFEQKRALKERLHAKLMKGIISKVAMRNLL